MLVVRGSLTLFEGSFGLRPQGEWTASKGESRYAQGEFKFPFCQIRRMSECRFIVYFEYAERRGEGDKVSNEWPKAGVVKVRIHI